QENDTVILSTMPPIIRILRLGIRDMPIFCHQVKHGGYMLRMSIMATPRRSMYGEHFVSIQLINHTINISFSSP
ncbi:MAG: hypothetical protein M0R68_11350, partial [Bacteroidetes bacterium]|nr:hypothetical protein [Bacteroidota bacterium]